MNHSFPYRQVHLDFHNSEHIPQIGNAFDSVAYVGRLQDAHVDSVVTFAKCHHGWSYYDTNVGERHPKLSFDLLRSQFDSCKEAGIQVPIYVSVGWDVRAARRHPEWRQIQPDGTFRTLGALGKNLQATWSYMCLNTPYLGELTAQIRELAQCFPNADGFWLDITSQAECCCSTCQQGMLSEGLDWTNQQHRQIYRAKIEANYLACATAAARSVNSEMPVFHNMGHVRRGDRQFLSHFSHLEVESLPTGGWGYDHGPLSARYIDPLGISQAGLTGKFHTVWGEFGGYKHPNALRYECASMLAHGQRCAVGDQLDPSGTLDESTYELIGTAFREVAARQSWSIGSRPVSEIGLLSSLSMSGSSGALQQRECPEDDGAVRILLEGHHAFDVIDPESDFGKYRLLILPDRVRLDAVMAEKLARYQSKGGTLLLSGESGLTIDGTRFAINVGATLTGKVAYEPTFVKAEPGLRPDFCDSPLVAYGPALQLQLNGGRSLAALHAPYFNRSPVHFSGHQHTAPAPVPLDTPAIVEGPQCIVFVHGMFTLYKQLGAVAHKQLVLKAIHRLLKKDPLLTTNLPSTARVMLRELPDGRQVLHLLHAIPSLRGMTVLGPLETIEDLPINVEVVVSVRTEQEVKSVCLVGELAASKITWHVASGRLEIGVDRFVGAATVEITYVDSDATSSTN